MVCDDSYPLAPLYDVISVGVYNGAANDLGLPLSLKTRKYSKYRVEDYVRMAKALGIGKNKAKIVLKQTIEMFLDRFPAYIDKTVAFETKHNLKIQNTRLGKKRFSAQLQSLYVRKLIQLKKTGRLQELGLIEKYGGALKRQKAAM